MPQNIPYEKLESFEGKILHPSLDIQDGILCLGFRYRIKLREEKEIFLVARDGNLEIIDADSFRANDALYFFDKKGRRLARLEERWGLTEMEKFLNDYSQLKSEAVISPQELLAEVMKLAQKYLELEKDIDYLLLAGWAIGTYFFPIFSAYPFLNIKAPKRSGKSQCLNFLKQLCFNAVKARPTLAALGDTVDSLRGTYLIDQADSLGRKGGEELLDILADSYKKGGGKRRMVSFDANKKREVVELETYGPKAFASIKELTEDLRDRCLMIPLIRSRKNFLDPDDENDSWKEIRGKIYKFLITDYEMVLMYYTIWKIGYQRQPEITGRELELWLPFEVILRCLGVPLTEIEVAKKRFLSQYGFSEYEPSEIEERVAKTLLDQLKNETEITLTPKRISELMEPGAFGPEDTPKQRAIRVGWAIKKFNLSSEKKPLTREGFPYLFEKKKIEGIYDSYFRKIYTPSTSDRENGLNTEESNSVKI